MPLSAAANPLAVATSPELDPAELLGGPDAGGDAAARADELTSLVDALQGELEMLRRRDVQVHEHLRRLDDELRLAARLQRDFLPKSLPAIGPVSIHALFRPAGYVSGDFYDVPRLDEDHLGLYLLDAVGHGTPAALLTMFMKNALRTKVITGRDYKLVDPGEAVRGLNEALVAQDLSLSTFATAVYAQVNCRTLELRMARAGHPHPVLLRGGQVRPLEADGPLLGIMPDVPFPEITVALHPGDRVVLFSDGVECCFDEEDAGNLEPWRRLLAEGAATPTPQLLADLTAALDNGCGSLEAPDDLTILVLDVAG